MKQSLLKIVSLSTRNLLSPSPFKPKPNYINTSLASMSSISFSKPRFFTSKNNSSVKNPDQSPPGSSLDLTQNEDALIHVEDVSKQELKSQIEKYLEGDADAIPSIFESILKRKLAGKHDESDDEIMKEFTSSKVNDVNDEDVSDEDFSDRDFSDEDVDSD